MLDRQHQNLLPSTRLMTCMLPCVPAALAGWPKLVNSVFFFFCASPSTSLSFLCIWKLRQMLAFGCTHSPPTSPLGRAVNLPLLPPRPTCPPIFGFPSTNSPSLAFQAEWLPCPAVCFLQIHTSHLQHQPAARAACHHQRRHALSGLWE